MLEAMFIYLGCLTSLMLSLEALKSYTEASSAPSSSQSVSRLSARVSRVKVKATEHHKKNFLLALNIDFTRDGAATDRGHV